MKGKGATRTSQSPGISSRLNTSGLLKPVSVAITVMSIVVAVVLLLLQTVNKPVTKLQINQDLVHVTKSMIESEVAPWFPEGYLSLDVQDIQSHLQDMVMVANVKVEKVWPDTLSILIEEERPVALWNGKNMLSENGDILPVAYEELQLPKLKGSNNESKLVMQHFLLFNRWGKRHQLELTGIQHSSAGWQLDFQTGLKIWLDNVAAMNGLQQLDKVIDQFDFTRIERIDMRYEQGFAVAWKDSIGQAQG